MKRYLIFVVFGIFLFAGCKDKGTGDDGGNAFNSLAVRAVNTGSGDLEIETDGEANVDFCYKSEGCEDVSGGSYHLVYEGKASNIDYSAPDKEAVGVRVSFRVTKGSGKAEIINGRTYRDDAGFLEFEDGKVLHTSSSFKKGDVVTFEYGDTDG